MRDIRQLVKGKKQLSLIVAVGGEDQFFPGSEPAVSDPFLGIGFASISARHCSGIHFEQHRCLDEALQGSISGGGIAGIIHIKQLAALVILCDQVKMSNHIAVSPFIEGPNQFIIILNTGIEVSAVDLINRPDG